MDIAIGRGLGEARELAGEHWKPLLVYAAIGVLLPFLLLASEPIFSLRTVMAILSDPFTYRVGGSLAGPLYLLGIVSVIVAGALLAAWNAVLAEMREGYISEIMAGMVAGFAYLFANILIYLVLGVLVVLPVLLLGGVAQWTAAGGGVVLEIWRFLAGLLGSWIGARLCLAGPILGAQGKLEPFSAFFESWRRTASAQWRLFGLYFAYGLVFTLAFAGLAVLHGVVIVNTAPGSVAETALSFGWLLLFAVYFAGAVLIPAGFYRASQPHMIAAEVFA